MWTVVLLLFITALAGINIPLMLTSVSMVFNCTVEQLLRRMIAVVYFVVSCFLFSASVGVLVYTVRSML